MRKKKYEKPSMKAYELKQRPSLLAVSGEVGATMDGTPWVEENI